MLVKYALFTGRVKAGQDAPMRRYVEDVLAPLWRGFQPSLDVRVLFNVERDANGPPVPLVLAVSYRDKAAMEQAMQTDARYRARDLLAGFYEQFFDEVTLLHYVFET